MMDFQEIKTYAEECLRDAPPPCVSACPLGVDVRGLVAKARAGRFDAAYRAYRESVLLPRVVSAFCEAPCNGVCVRELISDGYVDLKAIEAEVVAGAAARTEGRYAIRKKEERVAVIGGGLSGLACAWRLASKGYGITVFSRTARPLAEELIAALAADKEDLFRNVECEWRDEEGPDPNEAYDAIYNSTSQEAVGVAEQIAKGLAACAMIEERLRIGDLSGALGSAAADAERSFIVTESDLNAQSASVFEGFYKLEFDFSEGEEDGVSEAFRCPMCSCSACIDACVMIRWFKQNPKRIAADLGVSVLPVGGKIMRVASRMMNSCNLCGLCTAVCPVGVDTHSAIDASRRILKESGHLAPVFHDFWMEDLAFSMSNEAYGIVRVSDDPGRDVPLLFFPGCQLSASLPDTVARTYDYLREAEPGAAMLLGCCGIPADWAAEKEVFEETKERLRTDWESLKRPEILFACSACKKVFEEQITEARGRLVYEWIAERKCFSETPDSVSGSMSAAVFDPCNSRDDTAGQAAVRRIAEARGYALQDLALSGEEAACCGFGGHIYPANPGLLKAILAERADDAPGIPRLTYCANCRDLFLYKGIEVRHILEVVFPGERSGLPSLSNRRDNRRTLKTRYSGDKTTGLLHLDATRNDGEGSIVLEIPEEIEAKMDQLLLLREDVEKVIGWCETKGTKAIDSENGRSIGHYRDRLVTIWVEYGIVGKTVASVYNVYTHRMVIESGGEKSFDDYESTLKCARCDVPLRRIDTKFSYLGHEFSHAVPKCPVCGLVYLPEELTTGKISEVESMLEDK